MNIMILRGCDNEGVSVEGLTHLDTVYERLMGDDEPLYVDLVDIMILLEHEVREIPKLELAHSVTSQDMVVV